MTRGTFINYVLGFVHSRESLGLGTPGVSGLGTPGSLWDWSLGLGCRGWAFQQGSADQEWVGHSEKSLGLGGDSGRTLKRLGAKESEGTPRVSAAAGNLFQTLGTPGSRVPGEES